MPLTEGLPITPAEDQPTLTLTPSLALTYATNAGQTATSPVEANYLTPGLALEYIHPKVLGAWKLDATATVDADYYDRDANDFDESRLDGDVVASRHYDQTGDLILEYQARVSLDRRFANRNYTQERYKLGFRPDFGKDWGLKMVAEYRASDAAGQRRTLGAVSFGRSWSPAKGPTFAWAELIQLSDFRAGANSDRTDVFTKTALSATWSLGGFDVGVAATLFKNFSNRKANRYVDFEVGPTIARTIKF